MRVRNHAREHAWRLWLRLLRTFSLILDRLRSLGMRFRLRRKQRLCMRIVCLRTISLIHARDNAWRLWQRLPRILSQIIGRIRSLGMRLRLRDD